MLACHRLSWSAALALALLSTSLHAAETGQTTIDLAPNLTPGDTTRVTIQFEAGGHALVRQHDVEKGTVGETRQLPMSVVASLVYDERLLDVPTELDSALRPIAVRHYETAQATIKVDEGGAEPELADDRRWIVVQQTGGRAILTSPAGPLSRQQLDLVDVVGNTAAIDRLLPTEPVAQGDSWKHHEPEIAALLALDSIAVCEVQSVLEQFNSDYAKLRLAGVVHGTIDGAATEHELRAVYLVDRNRRRVKQMNLAVQEKRSIGDATPGIEGVAKVQIAIEPIAASDQLTDERVARTLATSATTNQNLLQDSPQLGFRLEHDRKWFVTSEARESIMLRRVDSTGLIAQCTIAQLPFKSEGRQTSLEQFQKDVVFALGKNFGELVTTRQWKNNAGHYCYSLVARGTVEQIPVEWHYYLVAQESGHRVSLAVTIEGPMVERLAQADRTLVESLELIPVTRDTATTATRPGPPTAK